MTGLTGRRTGFPQPECGPVYTELILQRLLNGRVLAAEEMTAAAIYLEDLFVRDRGDVHMAFCAGKSFVDGSFQVVFYFFLMT